MLSLLATNQTDKIRVKGCIKRDIVQCTYMFQFEEKNNGWRRQEGTRMKDGRTRDQQIATAEDKDSEPKLPFSIKVQFEISRADLLP